MDKQEGIGQQEAEDRQAALERSLTALVIWLFNEGYSPERVSAIANGEVCNCPDCRQASQVDGQLN